MNRDVWVDVCRPEELGVLERAAWEAFRQLGPKPGSPFLSLDYVEAAGRVVPHSYVAVVRVDSAPVALLPFQRRGRSVQPIGAPMTDYQALIAGPDCPVDLRWVLGAIGARAFDFSGLHSDVPIPGAIARQRLVADLGPGFGAYAAERASRFSKYWKDKERAARYLDREIGRPEYNLHDGDPEVLAWLIAQKRRQYAVTGQYDIFACGWTEALLRDLSERRTDTFGAMISTLRVDGRLLAASYSLRSGPDAHLWFPVYDPEFSRYAPGALLTMHTLRLAAEAGITNFDFGPTDETYKKYFTDPGVDVWDGALSAHGAVAGPAAARSADDWRLKIARRYRVMTACEPTPAGVLAASAAWAYSVARRRLTA